MGRHTRLVLMMVVSAALLGCAGGKGARSGGTLAQASEAYRAGQYERAYAIASPMATGAGEAGIEASYLAGISAARLGRDRDAQLHLTRAVGARDQALSGDAGAALGLLHAEHGRYGLAARALGDAAPKLTGENRARAYYHLADAQQKLGRNVEARTNFLLAREATSDAELRQHIDQQRATIGWTVQTGAYRDLANAQRAGSELASRVRGASPRIVPASDGRGTMLHLVQIGTFTTHDSARRFASQLGSGAAVVPIRQ